MKFEELDFQNASCCGTHRSATTDLSDGRQITVYDHYDQYTVAITKDGMLSEGMKRNLSKNEVAALIA